MTYLSTELHELIDGTVTIPTIPSTLIAINRIIDTPDGSAQQCGEVIVRDPAVATKLLRLANSSFYGLKHAVSSVPLACSIVGLRVIKNLVVQATVLEQFGTGPAVRGFDPAGLWDHSFKAAIAARMLAQAWPEAGLGKDEAYTCGLVHDVGKMILAQTQPQRFADALALSQRQTLPLAKAEGELFGFSHAHVAGLLAERWRLSPDLQAAVQDHHSPGMGAEGAKGFLVHAANTIAHQEGTGSGGWIGDLASAESLSAMPVAADVMLQIRAQVRQATMR